MDDTRPMHRAAAFAILFIFAMGTALKAASTMGIMAGFSGKLELSRSVSNET